MRGTFSKALGLSDLQAHYLRSLLRDPMMLVSIAYAFIVAIHAAATAMPDTLSRAPISIVDEDRSLLSQRIAAALYPDFFLPPAEITQAEMDARMDAGRDTFALDIPPNFQRDLLGGRRPAIQLKVDATRIREALSGSGYIEAIVADEIAAFLRRPRAEERPAVGLALRARFHPQLEPRWFGAIMEVINNVTMLAMILAGAALIREREHGMLEHLLVMPLTPFQIRAAKMWAMGLVVLVAAGLSLTLVVEGLLRVPIRGSIPRFLAGAALHVFTVTSLGIALGTLARSLPQFVLFMVLVILPLQMLSGAVTPRESMPEAVQAVMLAAPTTHFVALAQAILYRGAGLAMVWQHFALLTAIGAALFLFALARFRSSISTMA